ncbi:hypothetical protein FPZ12_035590 [Amycolatopsis acidicola]|uniref:Uncharacterized protein n=1 Tax=Amycolatopsis acidicola TaxID=2596893 RepID=A0A5N0UT10_9PSEU|nr:hypothetical protein [Amycolatopsis acidicola]KAA9152970.1 hypothetical protein FPZ12_035590 [Amycolatopsis acidicola]
MPAVSMMITVGAPDWDDEERDERAAELGHLLRELPGATLSTVPGQAAPDGSKGVSAVIGALGVTVAVSRKVLTAVLEVVRRWADVEASRKVVIEIDGNRLEFTGASAAQKDDALKFFIEHHSRGSE